ncbi:hypothetical protein J2S40_001152 [Nocardioides luteus]|uniref:Uncharacterized protein n=1 Tax=Nocardioides luteus TaxID=1844 RepID=A0ABQ5STW9_9ACTN|nr:hypothetical protein [Nocardioides luteus]GGR64824.1 hypothetical protein GCM10010197_35370 [Nocardioides luteus]GLJ66998.1 hypothetical protein GCM10017579_10340 [Nocardioides luteus]
MSDPFNLPPIEVTPRPTIPNGRKVTCSCGATFRLDSEDENNHYVWAVRWVDITRRLAEVSNLGHCPAADGFEGAVRRARSSFGINPAWYRGQVVR